MAATRTTARGDARRGGHDAGVESAAAGLAAAAPVATASGGSFAVGAKVEARYRGKSKYYAGVIAKDNGNGTYNYHDDGIAGKRVIPEAKF